LDLVISVGYRVNSQKATQFRIWATKVLRDHLLQGYTVNEKALLAQRNKLKELQNAINFIEDKSHQELLQDQSSELLSIIKQYTKSIDLLEQYDKKQVKSVRGNKPIYTMSVSDTKETIEGIRKNLMETKKNIGFFGIESSDKIVDIIGNLNQTFAGKELYKSIEERAANLLYMIIKDHPFIDGNKRIGSLLFIRYLDRNDILYRKTGERKINDNALVALALLVAISNPVEKDILIKVITSIISR
jgi:death-on-curing family protein